MTLPVPVTAGVVVEICVEDSTVAGAVMPLTVTVGVSSTSTTSRATDAGSRSRATNVVGAVNVGGSFSAATAIVTVATLELHAASLTWKEKLSTPLKSCAGV